MPSVTLPPAPHYNPAPCTKADLDYADLPIIDLAKTQSSEERQQLASQVQDALLTHGFFYVVNHGYLQSKVRFAKCHAASRRVSDEEKQVYAGTMKQTGSYQGYKLRQYWHIDNGVRDQIEHYNINRDVTKRGHPEVVRPFLPEIREFARFNHLDVLHPILRLIALSLELPEDALVNLHNDDAVGETYDFGSITILWSQPVAALQILSKDGKWRWVRHIEDALVVNAGDALDFLTGGYYKGTIHRVVQPPQDQQQYTRLGLFYFVMPDDNVKLIPMRESPVLQRVGINPRCEDSVAPTMEVWRKGRTSAYGQSELKSGQEKGVEEELINGVLVKHWN
ncbi:Clavaminate synthase-like protein [Melanogaster broomeanus]|nr:Clavaminate synthase-like protein [Melanogaster broomeanus]